MPGDSDQQCRQFRREDARALRAAVEGDPDADNRCLPPAVSHVWVVADGHKGEKMISAASVKIALIGGWSHSELASDAEAQAALEHCVALAKEQGASVAAVACTEQCRFKRVMAAAGFVEAKQATMYFRRI